MSKKLTITIAVIGVLILLVFGRFLMSKQAEMGQAKSIKAMSVPNVEIGTPFDVETSNMIDAPGRIVAVKSADVVARVQGMILKQNYKDGDFVKQGQLLYTIDPAEFQIAYDKARASLDSAKASQYQAQKDFERAAELVKNDYVSKSSYDQALATRDAANANVKASNAALNDARRLLSYTRVTAPITGKISATDITVGNYLSSPNTVLTKIVSVDPIFATYSVDSALFNQLRGDEIIPKTTGGQPIKAQLTLPDGTVYEKTGVADFSDNTISQTTGSITLRATFPNPDGILIPGDFVNVKVFSNKTIKRLAVPQTAVLQDSDGRYLFVVDDEGITHKRKIETDGQKDNNWIVLSGINKDEKFVTTGIIKVRDGAKVNIIQKEEKTKEVQKDNEAKNKEN